MSLKTGNRSSNCALDNPVKAFICRASLTWIPIGWLPPSLFGRIALQRHLSASTKFAHVESRLCSHKQPGEAVFYTSLNLCVRKHVCRSVVVGIVYLILYWGTTLLIEDAPGRHTYILACTA